jgi:hypothetical protein
MTGMLGSEVYLGGGFTFVQQYYNIYELRHVTMFSSEWNFVF